MIRKKVKFESQNERRQSEKRGKKKLEKIMSENFHK